MTSVLYAYWCGQSSLFATLLHYATIHSLTLLINKVDSLVTYYNIAQQMFGRLFSKIELRLPLVWRSANLPSRAKTYQSRLSPSVETAEPTVMHTGKIEKDVLLYTNPASSHILIVTGCIAGK